MNLEVPFEGQANVSWAMGSLGSSKRDTFVMVEMRVCLSANGLTRQKHSESRV